MVFSSDAGLNFRPQREKHGRYFWLYFPTILIFKWEKFDK